MKLLIPTDEDMLVKLNGMQIIFAGPTLKHIRLAIFLDANMKIDRHG